MNAFVKIQFYTFNFTKFIFSFTLDRFHTMLFCFHYRIWTAKYRLERLRGKICVFFIFNLLVPLFRPSLFRVVLYFYISIYRSIHRRCSVKKGVLKNFANLAGNQLCRNLFLLKEPFQSF